jgi:hypothetical protein
VLRDRRGRDEEILRERLDAPHERVGREEPAQAPAGHLEILREAVHHQDVLAVLRRGARVDAVGEALVDLVHEERAALLAREGRQRARSPRA